MGREWASTMNKHAELARKTRELTATRSEIGCAVPWAPLSKKYGEEENVVDWLERTMDSFNSSSKFKLAGQ